MKRFKIPFIVFTITFALLSFVQVKVENPMLLAERFFPGAGWAEILIVSVYGGFISYMMQDPLKVPKWRKITWTAFSFVFFTQLFIGILFSEKFLMSGKLHLPIPMMILAGPVFRSQLSVMTILFLSTVILTGPAWCSQFCYFGAFDNLAASGRTSKDTLPHKWTVKWSILFLVIFSALLFRWMNVPSTVTTIIAIGFGITGFVIMFLFSSRKKKMVHCTMYCPIGTIVNVFKNVNPFRLYIDKNCTLCMNCTRYCKYDALSAGDLKKFSPGAGCTLCGDCIAACHHDSIKYRFLKLGPDSARKLYLVLTISIHACCMALARI
jgi:polyferredoxin